MSENIFYTNTSSNSSTAVEAVPEEMFNLQESLVRPRDKKSSKTKASFFSGYGFPGFPFEKAPSNPDIFCQGEDIVLDAFLYFLGAPVDKDAYTIKAIVKSSVRDTSTVWTGEMAYGLYPQDRQGFYTIWIPGGVSAKLTAGTYYMDLILKEDVAAGRGPTDRTAQLLTYVFGVEYCAMSSFPENLDNSYKHRQVMSGGWPNTPNTVGS
jgi:hypothetical protein